MPGSAARSSRMRNVATRSSGARIKGDRLEHHPDENAAPPRTGRNKCRVKKKSIESPNILSFKPGVTKLPLQILEQGALCQKYEIGGCMLLYLKNEGACCQNLVFPRCILPKSRSKCYPSLILFTLHARSQMMAHGGDGILQSAQTTENRRVKLNVGGKQFETTASTLHVGGNDSLLAALTVRHSGDDEHDNEPIFIDRDPDIFSVLLSLLRSGRLPAAAYRRFSKQDLTEEALYYGIEGLLRSALSPPPILGIDATLVSTLIPAAEAHPTALGASSNDGSIWIAHGGQISVYDWNLTYSGTIRTHLDEITSIQRVWPEIAAMGSLETPGLHFYDFSSGHQIASLNWSDPSDPRVYKSRVTAIGTANSDYFGSRLILAAFECPHRENCILSVDRSTLQIVSEIGRQTGSGSKNSTPQKLVDLSEAGGVVFASAVNAGAFGYSGYMKLWDLRTGKAVWETNEPGGGTRSDRFGDAFAEADVDREEMVIYKVCWKSGDLAVADMRKLSEDPWLYLEERSATLRNVGTGVNSILRCYKGQVFVSRESGLEVWSHAIQDEEEDGVAPRRKKIFRRNFMDKEADVNRGLIRRLEVGGERLFLSRVGVEGVEVWESSDCSGAISLL